MTVTVLKTHFHQQKPKIVKHRDYKSFSNDNFRHLIIQECSNLNDPISLSSFLEICHPVLNITAPVKQKYIRANNSPFINKEVKKNILTRTRLHNKFLKNRTKKIILSVI